MAAKIRQLGQRLLVARGVPDDAPVGAMFAMSGSDTRDWDTENVWGMDGMRRVITPTRNVLLTNIMDSQTVPKEAALRIECDCAHLRFLARVKAKDLQHVALDGAGEDGAPFELTPEQVALVLTLVRGASPSRFRFFNIRPPQDEPTAKRRRDEGDVVKFGPATAEHPSFSWVVSTMGSGKSTTVLHAACAHIEGLWASCRDTFPSWNRMRVNGMECMPRPGTSICVARVVLIVAPSHLIAQWERVIRRTKSNVQLDVVTSDASDANRQRTLLGHALRRHAETPERVDEPWIVLTNEKQFVLATRNTQDRRDDCEVGVAALVLDEFGAWAPRAMGSRPDKAADPPPFISAFRTFAVSATPASALTSADVNSMSSTNHMKLWLYADPFCASITVSGKPTESLRRARGMWTRFVCSAPAPELQRACGESAAERMPPEVDLEVVRVPHDLHLGTFIALATDEYNEDAARLENTCFERGAYGGGQTLFGIRGLKKVFSEPRATLTDIQTAMEYAAVRSYDKQSWRRIPATVKERRAAAHAALAPKCTDEMWTAKMENERFADTVLDAVDAGLVRYVASVAKRVRCASCGAVPAADPRVNLCCTSIACGACHAAFPSCWCCTVPAKVRSAQPRPFCDMRGTPLVHALHEVMKRFGLMQRKKLCIFTASAMLPAESIVRTAAEGTGIRVFARADGNAQTIIDAVRDATTPAACHFSDHAIENASLSGMDMGFCDGVIVVGYLSNEQQAFSRVLRMGTAVVDCVKIVRIAFDEPAVDVEMIRADTSAMLYHVPTLSAQHVLATKGLAFSSPVGFGATTFGTLADVARDIDGTVRLSVSNGDVEAFARDFRGGGDKGAPRAVAAPIALPPPNPDFIAGILDACVAQHMHDEVLGIGAMFDFDADAFDAPAGHDAPDLVLPTSFRCEVRPADGAGASYAQFEIEMPPVKWITGCLVTKRSMHVDFEHTIACDCVPEDAGGVIIAFDRPDALTARWLQLGTKTPSAKRPLTQASIATFTVTVPKEGGSVTFTADVLLDDTFVAEGAQ